MESLSNIPLEMKVITARWREKIRRHIFSLYQIGKWDDARLFALHWINLVRLMIFIGASVRFGLLFDDYAQSTWLMVGQWVALGLLFIYLVVIQIFINKNTKSVRFRIVQIYIDWLLMSILFYLTLDIESGLFIFLALPLLLGAGMPQRWRQRFPPLLLCSFNLLFTSVTG